jgi:hypothetical protein
MATSSKYPDLHISLGGEFTPLGEDEPVFIVRAQDGFSTTAIRGYLTRMAQAGINLNHLQAVEKELHRFEQWMAEHASLVKEPDSPENEVDQFDAEWGPADG